MAACTDTLPDRGTALIVTVICVVSFPDASKVAGEGEKLQRTPFVARPFRLGEHIRFTVSLKPFTELTVRLNVADCPTASVALAGLIVVVPKSPTRSVALAECTIEPTVPSTVKWIIAYGKVIRVDRKIFRCGAGYVRRQITARTNR